MAGSYEPIPARVTRDIRILQHDLAKLRERVAAGRVAPHEYSILECALGTRIASVEAAVHARLLAESSSSKIDSN